jgi:hypothetical protein
MKINGKITILSSEDGVSIEVYDWDSTNTFCRIFLTPAQFCQAMSRLAHTECKTEVFDLDIVGKKMEHKENIIDLGFEYEKVKWGEERIKYAKKTAKEQCPVGWISDGSFRSQGSFFEKDGKYFARDIIRRWVDR